MLISVVIPHHNGHKILNSCLSSLYTSANEAKIKLEIIVVDNGSNDNSIALITKDYPQLKIILLKKNFGFPIAINQGVMSSTGNYLMICNNDLTVNLNFFDILIKNIYKFPECSCFCPTVLDKTGKSIESQGIEYYWSGKCQLINHGHQYVPKHSTPISVWGATGALAIYKKVDLISAGLFDETFFAYIEDVDLAFRFYKLGYSTLVIPDLICFHFGGHTSSKIPHFREFYSFRNWIKLIIKNYTLKQIIQNLPSIFVERLRNLSYLLKSFYP